MKTIYLFIVTIILSGAQLQAQEIERHISSNLDSYVGTWQYAMQADTFQIVLKKGIWDMDDVIIDCLYGVHYYKKDGKVIADYRLWLPDLSNEKRIIYATNAVTQEDIAYFKPNQLKFSFRDRNNRKTVDGWLTRDPNKPNELLWEFEKKKWREVVYFSDTPESEKELPGYSVPDNVILKKIK